VLVQAAEQLVVQVVVVTVQILQELAEQEQSIKVLMDFLISQEILAAVVAEQVLPQLHQVVPVV
jgi:hypothetical protein